MRSPLDRAAGAGRGASVAVVVALVVVGAVGVALGEALHDNPQPGGTQSYVRTLQPLPLTPGRADDGDRHGTSLDARLSSSR